MMELGGWRHESKEPTDRQAYAVCVKVLLGLNK